MDEARARRLQPHYPRAFFLAAFQLPGGRSPNGKQAAMRSGTWLPRSTGLLPCY
jgi:hypothetical protein